VHIPSIFPLNLLICDLVQAEQHFKDALSRTRHAVTFNMFAKLYLKTGREEQAAGVLQKGKNHPELFLHLFTIFQSVA